MPGSNIDREFFIKVYSGQNNNTDISYMVKSLEIKTTKEAASGTITIYDEYAYIAENVLTASVGSGSSSSGSNSYINRNFNPTIYGTVVSTNPNAPTVPYVRRQCTLYAINTLIKLTDECKLGQKYANWSGGATGYSIICFGNSGTKFTITSPNLYTYIKEYGFKLTSSNLTSVRSGDLVCRRINDSKQHIAIAYKDSNNDLRLNENLNGEPINSRFLKQMLDEYDGTLYCAHTLANTNLDGTPKEETVEVEITQVPEATDSTALESSEGNTEGQPTAKIQFGYISSSVSPIYEVIISKAQINVVGDGVEITYTFNSIKPVKALSEQAISDTFYGTIPQIVHQVIEKSPNLHAGCIEVDSTGIPTTQVCNNKNVCQFLMDLKANQTSDGKEVKVHYDLDGTVHFCSDDDLTEYKGKEIKKAYMVGGYNNNVISFTANINESAPTGALASAKGFFGTAINLENGLFYSFNSEYLIKSMLGAEGMDMPTGLPQYLSQIVGSVNNAAIAKLSTATLNLIGDPAIQYMDNIYVDVRLKGGVSHYTSGNWKIIEVSHSVGDSGFTTSLSLQRADMPETGDAYNSGSLSEPLGSYRAEQLKREAEDLTYKKGQHTIANNECDAIGFLKLALQNILGTESIVDSNVADTLLSKNNYYRFKTALELTWDNYTDFNLVADDIIVLTGKTSDSIYIIYCTQGTFQNNWECCEFCEFFDNTDGKDFMITPGIREVLISESSKKELNIAIYRKNN